MPRTTRRKTLETPLEPADLSAGDRVRLRILDAAEALFAERGFFGTSVRDITEHAGVRLAGINYHFGTKEELFRDVILRRAAPLNAERARRLEALPRGGTPAARVRAIAKAFVEPVLERALADEGFRNYCALMAQVANSRATALLLVAGPMNDVASAFVAAIRRVFPRAPARAHHHAYQLLLSATLYAFSNNMRLDSLTNGRFSSADFVALAASLVTFGSAGIAELCNGSVGHGRRLPPRKAARNS